MKIKNIIFICLGLLLLVFIFSKNDAEKAIDLSSEAANLYKSGQYFEAEKLFENAL